MKFFAKLLPGKGLAKSCWKHMVRPEQKRAAVMNHLMQKLMRPGDREFYAFAGDLVQLIEPVAGKQ